MDKEVKSKTDNGIDADALIGMLDSMMEGGVSRLKVDMSEEMLQGEYTKRSHHGRCDVGSPFATGKLFDLAECD